MESSNVVWDDSSAKPQSFAGRCIGCGGGLRLALALACAPAQASMPSSTGGAERLGAPGGLLLARVGGVRDGTPTRGIRWPPSTDQDLDRGAEPAPLPECRHEISIGVRGWDRSRDQGDHGPLEIESPLRLGRRDATQA